MRTRGKSHSIRVARRVESVPQPAMVPADRRATPSTRSAAPVTRQRNPHSSLENPTHLTAPEPSVTNIIRTLTRTLNHRTRTRTRNPNRHPRKHSRRRAQTPRLLNRCSLSQTYAAPKGSVMWDILAFHHFLSFSQRSPTAARRSPQPQAPPPAAAPPLERAEPPPSRRDVS